MTALDHRCGVLIVDDDTDLREMLAVALQADGYPILTAANGAEALVVLSVHPLPCLVLLDLRMPVMDGWETLRRMRADPRLLRVPVCVVSSEPEDAPDGVQRVLRKPTPLPALREIVRDFCDDGLHLDPFTPAEASRAPGSNRHVLAIASSRITLERSRALVAASRQRLQASGGYRPSAPLR